MAIYEDFFQVQSEFPVLWVAKISDRKLFTDQL